MAFNFMSGSMSYDPFSPYQQNYYNDPRRQGVQGSFNPYALSNFGSMQKGGLQSDPNALVKQPPVNPTSPPQIPKVPSATTTTNNASTYNVNPGTPPTPDPYNASKDPGGTPVPKPGGPGAPNPNSGAFNYAAFPTLQALYAAHPNGLPPDFDMDAWAQATGNQAVMNQSTSGDALRFTWNPDGPGYINPQTGETFDRPGETYPYTPPPRPPAPTFQPSGFGGNLQSFLSRYGSGNFPFGR